MRTIEVILNPKAGTGRTARLQADIQAHLEQLGLEASIHLTEGPGHCLNLVSDLLKQEPRTLAIVGGDGTLFETVNACMHSEMPLPDLALIPMGTGNDFAKALGLPMDWRDACDRLVLGTRHRVDVGQCNEVFFINSLGIGLDARIAELSQRLRWLPGNSSYVVALLQALISPKTPGARLAHDHGRTEQDITLIMVGNGGVEGGRFHLAPGADISDGLLDLIITPGMSRRQILRLIPKAMEGDVENIPGYQHCLTRRASIKLDRPTQVHADGEVIYRQARRLEIGVIAGALSFLC